MLGIVYIKYWLKHLSVSDIILVTIVKDVKNLQQKNEKVAADV